MPHVYVYIFVYVCVFVFGQEGGRLDVTGKVLCNVCARVCVYVQVSVFCREDSH